jgi:hypothetical protein
MRAISSADWENTTAYPISFIPNLVVSCSIHSSYSLNSFNREGIVYS